jgi:hypothetical protein
VAKAFGCRPSSLRDAVAGEALFDLAVYNVGSEIEGKINELAGKKDGQSQVKAFVEKLRRDAAVEERGSERREQRERVRRTDPGD